MARGKYKSTAEARQVRESALTEATRLRKRVAELESRVADLDRANIEQQAAHTARLTELRATLAALTSPKVAELEEAITEVTEERDHALIYAGELRQGMKRWADFLHQHFEVEHGMNPNESSAYVLKELHGEEPDLAAPNVTERGAEKLKEETRRKLKQLKADQAFNNMWVQTIPDSMP